MGLKKLHRCCFKIRIHPKNSRYLSWSKYGENTKIMPQINNFLVLVLTHIFAKTKLLKIQIQMLPRAPFLSDLSCGKYVFLPLFQRYSPETFCKEKTWTQTAFNTPDAT